MSYLRSRTLISPILRTALRSQPLNQRSFVTSKPVLSELSNVVTKDHRELEQYYNEIVNSSDPDHQQRYGNQFTWELARHSIAEELIVYPAFENYLGDKGKEMAEKDRKEHHEVKLFLKSFQNMKSTDPDYVPKLKGLMDTLRQHIKEEEKDDLPELEKVLAGDHNHTGVSESLAKNFDRTKLFVPTRSHPSAGEKPPFESVMGLLAAPIDKLADLFRKFPDKSISSTLKDARQKI